MLFLDLVSFSNLSYILINLLKEIGKCIVFFRCQHYDIDNATYENFVNFVNTRHFI